MKVLIRKTLTGSEYWDTEGKKVLFIPMGKKIEFQVADSQASLIGGVDLAGNKDMTVVNGRAATIGQQTKETAKDIADSFESIDEGIKLEDLNAEQLLSFAKQSDINVPGNMKKEETIRKFINDALTDVK